MKLNKIVLNGFKSFGEKTVIEFDSNLNGIVGPNGSGKSNIIDAIKWVLGQQKSSDLRAKTNIDIIFSGSENKKPKNVAEVTLFFDNSDNYLEINYSEVAIKRRLFRNGDNEYFINDTKCRLKDVNNLVMDKGFGKDSFSIISQGKVEEIIMSKPNKRREIIDEVAGIQKYRVKKNLTLKKLEKVSVNIEKIDFIVDEINNVIEPLKKASEKALKYNLLKKELTKKEKALIANKIFYLSQDLTFIQGQLLTVKKEVTNKNDLIVSKESEITQLNTQISNGQQEISKLNVELNKVINEEIIISNRLKLIQEKNKIYSEVDDDSRISYLESEIQRINYEIEQLNLSLSSQMPLKNSYFEKLNNLKVKYQTNTNKLYKLKQEEQNYNFKRENEKYPYAVREILKLNISGIDGTVKENIDILVGYEHAINTIIGNRKNEIITEDEHVVKQCIEYLKQNKLPKVTFIPLNKVIPRTLPKQTQELINEQNCLGKALDFVVYDKRYEKAMSTLLGNVLICKDLDQANKLNDMLSLKHQIVTLDGDVIMPNGKISGGYDKKTTQIEQKNTIEKILSEIKEIENLTFGYEKEIQTLSLSYSELKIEVELKQKKIQEYKLDLKDKQDEYNKLTKTNNTDDQSLIVELNSNLASIKEQKISLINQIDDDENKIKDFITKKEEENDLITALRGEYKQKVEEESDINIKEQRIKEQVENQMTLLREKYQISYQKAYEDSIQIQNIQEYEVDVKLLKKNIKDLGFVNLESITQYEVERSRLTYYSSNLEDLQKSKTKIQEVLSRIDEFVAIKFEEVFEALNNEFKKVFEQLFDGGNATLVLTDPSDMLNTGVEIIAKPPGKKSQVIGLLSGGEKALTAISLLFAILKIRIVPFAILDEVEAALDEANVIRYVQYLRIFSENTQFLVITHRQATMEKLDKLYGVTMIEKGISSIIDIKMTEDVKKII